jgi:hypothetical protein
MITRRLSIMLGVTMATAGMALLAPVSGAMARGGGSSTNGSFPTGPNQNLNGGNSSSGGGSGNTHGPFPTGPNQNLNGGNSSSGSGGSGKGNGGHGLPPGSGSGGGGKPPNGGGPGRPPQ